MRLDAASRGECAAEVRYRYGRRAVRRQIIASLRAGRDLYFAQRDDRSDHTTIYRMRVSEVSSDHLAFEAENVSSMKWIVIPIFGPHQIRTAFFFDQESPGVWDFYSLLRVGDRASFVGSGHDASFLNRAIGLYRHVAGIPTDLDPPAMP
jgi:hypothetical protein